MDIALRNYFRYRQRKVDTVINNPEPFQKAILSRIINRNIHSEYGQKFDFQNIQNQNDYVRAVPIVKYETIAPSVSLMMDGKKNVLTSEPVNWFAKSSGTSNNRSKYIPVTKNYLINGHLKCTWTTASIIYNEDPSAKLFKHKNLIMGGSLEKLPNGIHVGDISAVLLHNFPKIGRRFSTPDFETALIDDWELKIQKIVEKCSKEKVTTLGGVPTWTMVLIKKLLLRNEAANMSEVWPDLRTYLHGGVGFEPYRKIFRDYMPSEKTVFREVYNASEGYFGIQNKKDQDGIALLFDHEVYYEFLPFKNINDSNPETVKLSEVELGEKYALIISNTSGLYRYLIGDLIEFVSLRPYKIKVRGRTQQSLNVFGEELMIANTELAIAKTSEKHHVQVMNYSVAPIFMSNDSRGGHEWVIEFHKRNINLDAFAKDLDTELRKINSDYDAKRFGNLALKPLIINQLSEGTFDKWFKSKGKYGGQAKVQKLNETRNLIEELKTLSNEILVKKTTNSSFQ